VYIQNIVVLMYKRYLYMAGCNCNTLRVGPPILCTSLFMVGVEREQVEREGTSRRRERGRVGECGGLGKGRERMGRRVWGRVQHILLPSQFKDHSLCLHSFLAFKYNYLLIIFPCLFLKESLQLKKTCLYLVIFKWF
jgi:hypothetical protein